jgi:hypothetical protein
VFGIRSQDDVLASARSAEGWLRRRFGQDPLATLVAASELLRRATAEEAPLAAGRLAALLKLDEGLASSVQVLSRALASDATPQVQARIRGAAQGIAESFFASYQDYFECFRLGLPERWLEEQMPRVILRMQQHLFEEARLRLFAYEEWPAARWPLAHELYLSAEERDWQGELMRPLAVGAPTTTEREYVMLLLLLRLEGGSLTPAQVEVIAAQLRQWSELLLLEAERPPGVAWEVDLRSERGLCPAAVGHHDVRYWDPSRVLQVIDRRTRELRAAESDPVMEWHLATLARLAQALSAEATRPRAKRQHGGHRPVPVAVGFSAVCEQLRRGSLVASKTHEVWTGGYEYSRAGATGIVTDGNGFARPADFVAPGDPAADRGRFWTLLDRSDSGARFSTRLDGEPLPLGTLVALLLTSESWTIAVVRRVQKTAADTAQYGLEILGDGPRLVSLNLTPGDGAKEAGPLRPPPSGISVSLRKRDGITCTVALLVVPEICQSAPELELETSQASARVRLDTVVALGPDWTCVSLAAVPLARVGDRQPTPVAGWRAQP